MKALVEKAYDKIFHAKSAEDEWRLWHEQTVADLRRMKASGEAPSELGDPAEVNMYRAMAADITSVTSKSSHRIRRMLEVACGSGALSNILAQTWEAQYLLLDIDRDELGYAKLVNIGNPHCQGAVQAKADALPLADGSMDFVHSVGLLEHFPDDWIGIMVEEMRRVLAAGGYMYLAVPNHFSPRMISIWKKYGKGSERLMTKGDLQNIARDARLQVMASGHTSTSLPTAWRKIVPDAVESILGRSGLGFLNYVVARKTS